MERVDFDQYAGQYEAILAAQTNFFDGDSDYFARYKIELAQQLVGNVEHGSRFRLWHRPQHAASARGFSESGDRRLRPLQ